MPSGETCSYEADKGCTCAPVNLFAPGSYLPAQAATRVHEASMSCVLQEAGAPFSESLADLSDVQLSHAGADSAGSRVLEAFLEGHASAKTKKRALRKLRGSYARLAATPGGSHAVQACYKAGVRPIPGIHVCRLK